MSKLWDDDEEDEEQPIEIESEVQESDDDEGDGLPASTDESLVRPVDNIDEVVDVYEQFEEIKTKLLDFDEDVTEMGRNNHINKSGWRKIATAFNLSVETVDVQTTVEEGIVKYIVRARAVAPNGKSSTATGLCASNESNFMRKLVDDDASIEEAKNRARKPEDVLLVDGWYRELKDPREVNEHNIMATAETRAINRAISDLVGGGEVSAEEMGSMKKEQILSEE